MALLFRGLTLPGDPLHEFVVSVDTAHVRGNDPKAARNFEVVIARCGRGGRGTEPGHYFATTDTSQREIRPRTLQALQTEGYAGHGEITILSDGAEIMKRLPRALPKPTTHIIDWFHLAMKIRPMQQIADHIVGNRSMLCERLIAIDRHIARLKWKLWHGQVDRAISALERILLDMNFLGQTGDFSDFSAARLHNLGQQLLTYICSNTTHCRLWRKISLGPKDRDKLGRVGGKFFGRKTDGEKSADALVPKRCPLHAAGPDR